MAKALTARSVAAAKPVAGARVEIPDGNVVGLYLVVQKAGARSWAVRYRFDGKPGKLTLGPVLDERPGGNLPEVPIGAAMTLVEARSAGRTALIQVAAGINPAASKAAAKKAPPPAEVLTFGALAADFIERWAKKRNKAWEEVERIFKTNCASWSGRPAASITKQDVRDVLKAIMDRNAPIMANRTLANLKKLFAWAKDEDLLAVNPAAELKPPAPRMTRDRVLTDAEVRSLWQALDATEQPFSTIVKMLLLTGQRRDEVAGMHWAHVEHNRGLWTLPRELAKNDRTHEVPLVPVALALLADRPRIANTPYVFPGRRRGRRRDAQKAGAPIEAHQGHYNGFGKAKTRLDELCGVTSWKLHDLRRTVASGMAKLKIAPHVIEAVLNHKTGTVSGVAAVYNRYDYADEKRAALELWAAKIERLLSPPDDGQAPSPA